MKATILLINGPPSAGKDTLANIIKELLGNSHIVYNLKLTGLMDKVAKLVLNLKKGGYAEWREDKKDEPLMHFDTTMRKFLIGMSEDWLKPHLGSGIMGYHAAVNAADLIQNAHMMYDKDLVITVSDCGFQEEFEYFKQTIKQSVFPKGVEVKIQLINLLREPCNFDNDSREWVEDEGSIQVHNHSSVHYLKGFTQGLLDSGKLL